MEKLKTNDLLRYAFSGGITLFILYLLCKSSLPLLTTDNEFINATFIGVFALIIGSLIYTIHRAILYPLVYRIVLIFLCLTKRYKHPWEWTMLIPWRPTGQELILDIERWKRRKNENTLQNEFLEWGSQIHFLLTTFWGILVALIICKQMTECIKPTIYCYIIRIALFILFSSLVSIWRHLIYEQEAKDYIYEPKAKTS